MTARFLMVGIVVFLAGSANATLFMSDDFESYTLGNLVPQDSWTAHSGAGSNQVQVLTAPAGLAGKAIQVTQVPSTTREDVNKPLGVTMAAGQKWYAGFDVIVTGSAPIAGTNKASDYFAHFKTSATVFPSKIGVAESTGSDFTFYLHQGSGSSNPPNASGVTSYWPTGFAFGTVHRLVASYEFSTGKGELWVDPVLSLGEGGNAKIESLYSFSATAAVVQYAFRQGGVAGNGSTETVDNLLVADTWAEVAVPEPATLALLGLALPLLRRRK